MFDKYSVQRHKAVCVVLPSRKHVLPRPEKLKISENAYHNPVQNTCSVMPNKLLTRFLL